MENTKQAKILIAEDSRVNQMILTRVLKQIGLYADVVSSGSEAVVAVENNHYDIVIMDVVMPEMDGIEATRTITDKYPVADRPKIVALTADTSDREKERCRDAGMDDYLSKPVRLDELYSVLAQWIQFQIRPVRGAHITLQRFPLAEVPVYNYKEAV
jgi:CheY-like chemotaxis protein